MLLVECPWCKITIEVSELNCRIFRCGIFKDTLKQLEAHASQERCQAVLNKIYGCGRPFQVVQRPSGLEEAIKCDYI
jgi:hypothetical protein